MRRNSYRRATYHSAGKWRFELRVLLNRELTFVKIELSWATTCLLTRNGEPDDGHSRINQTNTDVLPLHR